MNIQMHIPEAGGYRHLQVRFMVVFDGGSTPRLEAEPPTSIEPLSLPGPLPLRELVDVTVEGHAYPMAGHQQSQVRLVVGEIDRRILVQPARRALSSGRGIVIERADTDAPVALDLTNAYGGLSQGRFYPRNPAGRGFALEGDPRLVAGGIELPRFELPEDQLTSGRVIAQFERWWEQPLPALVSSQPLLCFSRFAALGLGVDKPIPVGATPPEVARGELTADDVTRPFPSRPAGPRRAWAQEAPWGQRLREVVAGLDVTVEGCLPRGQTYRRRLTASPPMVVSVDGVTLEPRLQPQHIRVRPERDELAISYGFDLELSRSFIPGVHARIPIAIHVAGQVHPFPTPTPVRQTANTGTRSRA